MGESVGETPLEKVLADAKAKIERFTSLLQKDKITGKIIIEINVRNGGIGNSTIQLLPAKESIKV